MIFSTGSFEGRSLSPFGAAENREETLFPQDFLTFM
jgi:hypothetical protein